LLRNRLERRRGHFAGDDLLDSQLTTLEFDEALPVVDADAAPDEVTAAVLRATRH